MMFKSLLYNLIVLSASFSIFVSCKKDAVIEAPKEMGYNYFPLNIGHTVFYDADSVIYFVDENDSVKTKKVNFKIKDVITSTFYDNSNRLTHIIERYVKKHDTLNWEMLKICTANLLPVSLLFKEDNYTYVALSFPVKTHKKWNGNSYNTLDPSEFSYTESDQAMDINGLSFDSTLSVLRRDDENVLSKDYNMESYARNAGLIYKEMLHYDMDYNKNRIKSGYEIHMNISSYIK